MAIYETVAASGLGDRLGWGGGRCRRPVGTMAGLGVLPGCSGRRRRRPDAALPSWDDGAGEMACSGGEGDRGIWLRDPEADALLQVEVSGLRGVREVSDGQVLAGLEE